VLRQGDRETGRHGEARSNVALTVSPSPCLLVLLSTSQQVAHEKSPALAKRLSATAGVGSWKYRAFPFGWLRPAILRYLQSGVIVHTTVYLSMYNTEKFCKFFALPYLVCDMGVLHHSW
jgi:hypothetical protein